MVTEVDIGAQNVSKKSQYNPFIPVFLRQVAMETTYSSGADLQEIVNKLYKKYQDILEDYEQFSCQRFLFVTALKNRLPLYSAEPLRQSRVHIGVRTLQEVRALLHHQWSSDSENTSSSTNTHGTLELFLNLVDQLRKLEENLTSLLPEHVQLICQDELGDWRKRLLEKSDFSFLDKEKFTLSYEDQPGYAGVVSLLPFVLDIGHNTFQILNEYLSARKVTPYRPQLLSLGSIADDEEDIFVTAKSYMQDKENNKSTSPVLRKQQSPTRSPRKEHETQGKSRRKTPYAKLIRKSPRQKTATRLPPQTTVRQPSIVELGRGPMIRQSSRLPSQYKYHPKQSKYIVKQEVRSLSQMKYGTSQVRTPRMKTPIKRLNEKYDHVRFPNIEKVVHSGKTDWKNLQDVKNAQNYEHSRLSYQANGVSPRAYYKGQHRYPVSPVLSQSLPHTMDNKNIPTPLQSSYDPRYRQRRSPYPTILPEARQRHVSTSSQDSADAAPVSVIYHGSTIYNYPGEGTTEMDYTTRAIKRLEERLLPQMDLLKDKMRRRDIKQKDNSNLMRIVEDKLKKMQDEIEDIKTRQLLHNYYLRDFHKVLTNKDLDIIKDHIAYRDLTELGIKLGLSEIDVEDVKEQTNALREQVFQILLAWRNKVGKYASLDLIIEVLIKMKRRDTATLIINDMKQRS
ncbi:uncharacterized protein LOC102800710 [Saccoglossus kowalevskii]|uniref:Uncharacterized protein LOC102800710 n=1 Tax=Saccoglossus kowalevskii TaxID=10224 RepID=A0ABM0MIN4_SACKO|nr:PREDICTED: uncharacterized protein LOC102800710 [Saccoglossus kowalevskii]